MPPTKQGKSNVRKVDTEAKDDPSIKTRSTRAATRALKKSVNEESTGESDKGILIDDKTTSQMKVSQKGGKPMKGAAQSVLEVEIADATSANHNNGSDNATTLNAMVAKKGSRSRKNVAKINEEANGHVEETKGTASENDDEEEDEREKAAAKPKRGGAKNKKGASKKTAADVRKLKLAAKRYATEDDEENEEEVDQEIDDNVEDTKNGVQISEEDEVENLDDAKPRRGAAKKKKGSPKKTIAEIKKGKLASKSDATEDDEENEEEVDQEIDDNVEDTKNGVKVIEEDEVDKSNDVIPRGGVKPKRGGAISKKGSSKKTAAAVKKVKLASKSDVSEDEEDVDQEIDNIEGTKNVVRIIEEEEVQKLDDTKPKRGGANKKKGFSKKTAAEVKNENLAAESDATKNDKEKVDQIIDDTQNVVQIIKEDDAKPKGRGAIKKKGSSKKVAAEVKKEKLAAKSDAAEDDEEEVNQEIDDNVEDTKNKFKDIKDEVEKSEDEDVVFEGVDKNEMIEEEVDENKGKEEVDENEGKEEVGQNEDDILIIKDEVMEEDDVKPKRGGAKKRAGQKDQLMTNSTKNNNGVNETEVKKPKVAAKKDVAEDEEISAKIKKTSTQKKASDNVLNEKPKKDTKRGVADSANSIPAKKIKGSGKQKPEAKVKTEEEEEAKTELLKIVAPVDPECVTKLNSCYVYYEENDVYDAMLNQTYMQNNNNKFYLLQILKDKDNGDYYIWFRWGRVGVKGQSSLNNCKADLAKAKKLFEQKFKDKTKNDWSQRENFEKVDGKYDLVSLDYNIGDTEPVEEEPKTDEKEVEKPKSELDPRLQVFTKLIFNTDAMEATVKEMKYNAKKAPLGKLTSEQVIAGYAALKEVERCISDNNTGLELFDACNAFYTRIPHDFGMKRPPLISTFEDLQSKIELLKTLGDISVAMTILKEKVNLMCNPIDSHYHSLNCNLKPVEKDDPDFVMVEEYLQNTHALTHRTYNMELVDLFDCDRATEESKFKDVGNKMLLWHGSRLTNAVGILKQGLRIAPPEAPSTGYMFGKGVYFADMSSKSANYCYTNRKQNNGILFLCEVAVGTPRKLLSADYNASNLPKGFDSVLGQGSVVPDPKMIKTLSNGTVVPCGKSVESNVKNPDGYTLNYNEYIVYDVDQIKIKYILRVKFCYKY